MNDIQAHLLRKIREAADERRASCRGIATAIVTAVLDGYDQGMERDEIIDELAAGLFDGRTRL